MRQCINYVESDEVMCRVTFFQRQWAIILAVLLVTVGSMIISRAGGQLQSTSVLASGTVQVVAAENFWGSIAAQEGGTRVHLTSIIINPNTDPHSYEATPSDARTVADARYVILNGAGYDSWVRKLLDANPVRGRQVLDIGHVLGKKAGDNPHFWYGPANVIRIATQITATYKRLDPAGARYFDRQHIEFIGKRLYRYRQLIATIQRRYHGTPVGATESIFVPLASALHLNVLTPSGFMKAVAQGSGPTARDKATFDQQITGKQIKIFVYNRQNSTPDVEALKNKALAGHIPVVPITETLVPVGATFQDWQVRELNALEQALGRATHH